MTGLLGTAKDVGLLIRTDKRIWAASGFLSCVFILWLATGSWREPVPVKEKPEPYVKQKNEYILNALADFHKDLQANRKVREELSASVVRTANDLQTDKEKMEWSVNALVGRLNDVTNKIEKLAKDIGPKTIQEAELNRKIGMQTKEKPHNSTKKYTPGEN